MLRVVCGVADLDGVVYSCARGKSRGISAPGWQEQHSTFSYLDTAGMVHLCRVSFFLLLPADAR